MLLPGFKSFGGFPFVTQVVDCLTQNPFFLPPSKRYIYSWMFFTQNNSLHALLKPIRLSSIQWGLYGVLCGTSRMAI